MLAANHFSVPCGVLWCESVRLSPTTMLYLKNFGLTFLSADLRHSSLGFPRSNSSYFDLLVQRYHPHKIKSSYFKVRVYTCYAQGLSTKVDKSQRIKTSGIIVYSQLKTYNTGYTLSPYLWKWHLYHTYILFEQETHVSAGEF